jgi:hypothetical protein
MTLSAKQKKEFIVGVSNQRYFMEFSLTCAVTGRDQLLVLL